MRELAAFLVCAIALAACANAAPNPTAAPARDAASEAAWNHLSDVVRSPSFQRLRIFVIPADLESIAARSPGSLKNDPIATTCTMTLSQSERQELADAVRATMLRREHYQPDVKWEIQFLGANDAPMSTLHLTWHSGDGDVGSQLDGENTTVSDAVPKWLDRRFLPLPVDYIFRMTREFGDRPQTNLCTRK